jgi:hypothetical protein
VQAFLFSKDEEAVESAFQQADENAEVEMDDTLTERFDKAQETTWREMGPLGKLHNLAVFIRSSNLRYNEFMEHAGKVLTLDNDTRWNSWFIMLEIALELRPFINQFIEKHYESCRLNFLSPDDWKALEQTYEFLQPFFRVTKETEGDRATLDRTLYTMDFLISHFRKSKVRSINRSSDLADTL